MLSSHQKETKTKSDDIFSIQNKRSSYITLRDNYKQENMRPAIVHNWPERSSQSIGKW